MKEKKSSGLYHFDSFEAFNWSYAKEYKNSLKKYLLRTYDDRRGGALPIEVVNLEELTWA